MPKNLMTAPSDLTPNPWNPNTVDPDTLPKLRRSIETDGFTAPIVVRDTELGLEIVDGEHRWRLAKEMGIKEIPVRNLGDIDDASAKRIGILLNARYGVDDMLLLAKAMEGQSIEEWSDLLPTSEADLAAIFDASTIDLDDLGFADEEEETQEPAARQTRTHSIMRFKFTIADAERMKDLIDKTKKLNEFTTEDDMTNAGDALVSLLMPASDE